MVPMAKQTINFLWYVEFSRHSNRKEIVPAPAALISVRISETDN